MYGIGKFEAGSGPADEANAGAADASSAIATEVRIPPTRIRMEVESTRA